MACTLADSLLLFKGSFQKPLRKRDIAAHYSPGVFSSNSDGLIRKGFRRQRSFVNRNKVTLIRAVAVPVQQPAPVESVEYRKQLAEDYGFRQIAEPLPSDVFEIDDVKAWKSVLISATSYALGIFMISKAPWFLLPLAWAWTGTAVTGFFVIGHDCAHKSFSSNKLVEDIVGTLAFLPLIYPYEPWRFKHDRHHAKTNMLSEDTAWNPVSKDEFESSPLLRKAIIYGYGPFRCWMSIAHWLLLHFDLKKFRPSEVKRVKISLASAGGSWQFVLNLNSDIKQLPGIDGIVGRGPVRTWPSNHGSTLIFSIILYLMSTFTMVHHTAPHIPFRISEEWNAAQAQLNGTVHCDYPKWIEILCHDINVHIPHHISPRIPSYNLRAAHKSIEENWGKYLNEASWNWRLMKTIMTVCHVYDKEQNYVAFDDVAPEDSGPIAFLKKSMPDYA
ncbi:hypothetical protein ACSQ67_006734 [Phaseolus vulgaris]